jgi:hypothetical protein
MDPELHDAPMYVKTLALVLTILAGCVFVVATVWAIGETIEHFAK